MLRLKRITLRNWMTVKSATVEFPECGLILVIGRNTASDGSLASVGSGKTALGEAISCTLLGAQGRFSHLGYYASDASNGGNMYVKVEAELMKKPLVVETGFRCEELVGAGGAIRYTFGNEKPFQAADLDVTRAHLQKTIRVSPALSNWACFIDGDRLKFDKLSQEDAVNLLMDALAQPPWTELHESASKSLLEATRQSKTTEQLLMRSKALFGIKDVDVQRAQDDYELAKARFEAESEEITQQIEQLKKNSGADRLAAKQVAERMAQIKVQLAKIEDENAEKNHKLDIQRQTLRDNLALLDDEFQSACTNKSDANAQWTQATAVLARMCKVPKNCPTCGKVWDKAHSEQELVKAEAVVESHQKNYNSARGTWQTITDKRTDISNQMRAIEEQMRQNGAMNATMDLADEYEQQESLARRLNASADHYSKQIVVLERGPDNSNVNKKLAILEERRNGLEEAHRAIDKAAADLAMDAEMVKVVDYWQKAFGPTGIPNMILTDAVPMLNRAAQRVYTTMTGSTIEVAYSTTRELASGQNRPKLVTKVTNKLGSKRAEGGSKGERGLINLVIAETLNEVGQVSRRCGFRWYDEPFPNHDAAVRKSCYAYLKDVARRYHIPIFLVDHNQDVMSYCDYTLLAEKRPGVGTTYCWL
jgi:DNA repair exonuclease SbcCD ATPase subunit